MFSIFAYFLSDQIQFEMLNVNFPVFPPKFAFAFFFLLLSLLMLASSLQHDGLLLPARLVSHYSACRISL